jgi:hypothetical protein
MRLFRKEPKYHFEIAANYELSVGLLEELEKNFNISASEYFLCAYENDKSLLITENEQLADFFKGRTDLAKEYTDDEARKWLETNAISSEYKGNVTLTKLRSIYRE